MWLHAGRRWDHLLPRPVHRLYWRTKDSLTKRSDDTASLRRKWKRPCSLRSSWRTRAGSTSCTCRRRCPACRRATTCLRSGLPSPRGSSLDSGKHAVPVARFQKSFIESVVDQIKWDSEPKRFVLVWEVRIWTRHSVGEART